MTENPMPVPYEGDKPYVFISYSHKDYYRILPIITEMQQRGCRFWYDKGSESNEWRKVITDHIIRCNYFIAFISNNYFSNDADNCETELSYAGQPKFKKERLLIYLEKTDVPAEDDFYMHKLFQIDYYTYNNDTRSFYDELFRKEKLKGCCEQINGLDIRPEKKKDEIVEPNDIEESDEKIKTAQDFMEAAKQGDLEAQYHLGKFYLGGNGGVENDNKRAFELFKEAAKHGYAKAQSMLGWCYECGSGTPTDITKAIELFQEAAGKGDTFGQVCLGVCYVRGEGVEQDYEQAIKLFREAADHGDQDAKSYLDICYKKGWGIPQDPEKKKQWLVNMADWYESEAERGNAHAQHVIGDCYMNGIGRVKDEDNAGWWYRQGAEKGNVDAQFGLGEYYARMEDDRAEDWFKEAAENGHAIAQYNMGISCLEAAWNTPPYAYLGDKELFNEAIDWFRKVDKQEDADKNIRANAQTRLGECYEYGLGVGIDNQEAVQWYSKAAKQGDSEAQYHLGKCYEKGCGGILNYEVAFDWYKRAAKQGNSDAQYRLGKCYENGKGTEKSCENAFKLYKNVADNLDFFANMEGYDCSEEASVFVDLGRCYEYGLGVHKSFLKADDCYRKAIYYGVEGDDYNYAQQHRDDFRVKDLI